MTRKLLAAVAVAAMTLVAAPDTFADSRYDYERVWYVTGIDVLDGQFENYTSWLAEEWSKFRKLNAQYGNEVGYHVLVDSSP
jgi:hypothetical protein